MRSGPQDDTASPQQSMLSQTCDEIRRLTRVIGDSASPLDRKLSLSKLGSALQMSSVHTWGENELEHQQGVESPSAAASALRAISDELSDAKEELACLHSTIDCKNAEAQKAQLDHAYLESIIGSKNCELALGQRLLAMHEAPKPQLDHAYLESIIDSKHYELERRQKVMEIHEVERLDAKILRIGSSVHSSSVQVTELSSDKDELDELSTNQQLSALFADIECQEAEIAHASTQLERRLAEATWAEQLAESLRRSSEPLGMEAAGIEELTSSGTLPGDFSGARVFCSMRPVSQET